MARIIDSMDLAKFGEKVTSCPKCKKVIACVPNEVFLDLSHGSGHLEKRVLYVLNVIVYFISMSFIL